jgi:hypothetical protein
MTSATEPDGWTIYSAERVRGRQCGSCTACCTLVPVELPAGVKPAGVRCPHVRSTGCSIYHRRPEPCAVWSCRWLFDPDTAALRRPDRAGYIVDPLTSTILVDGKPMQAVQVWVDPARPEAFRDPALLAYLADIAARHGYFALVRYGNQRATALLAPALSPSGGWEIDDSNPLNTEAEMAVKLAAAMEHIT